MICWGKDLSKQQAAQLPSLPRSVTGRGPLCPGPSIALTVSHSTSSCSNLARTDRCQDAEPEIPGIFLSASQLCDPKVFTRIFG